jgi:type IV pilus assembly protein PilX
MNSRAETAVVRQLHNRTIARRGQRGVVMFVALVVLIVMTLAGLAMLRQMSSGVSIAGNIAFKQAATAVADVGVETARVWIGNNPATLGVDQVASGYYATWALNFDPTSAAWAAIWQGAPVLLPAVTGNTGNTVRYVIERLCSQLGPNWGPGMLPTQECADSVGKSTSGQSMGGVSYTNPGGTTTPPAPYYRVTTQVLGPRNTVSYTQVVLN